MFCLYLGGGIALGTVTLIESDRHSNFADTLINYALAEGMSVGHDCALVLPSEDLVGPWLARLPFNLSLTGDQPDMDGSSSSMTVPPFSATVSRFCCSYDLGRRYALLMRSIHYTMP